MTCDDGHPLVSSPVAVLANLNTLLSRLEESPTMKMSHLVVTSALAVLLTGCGGGGSTGLSEGKKSGAESAAEQSLEQAKARLKPIAESGVAGGSSIYGLDEVLKKAGKEALIPELTKLMKAKKPDEVKAIAKKILEQL